MFVVFLCVSVHPYLLYTTPNNSAWRAPDSPADNGPAFLMHAIICAAVYLLASLGGLLHFYGAAFLMWELSTPFMYVRWMLLKAGWGESMLLTVVNVAFMAVFFGCRNVWGPSESISCHANADVRICDLLMPPPGSPLTRAHLSHDNCAQPHALFPLPVMAWDFWKASGAELEAPVTYLPPAALWIIRCVGLIDSCEGLMVHVLLHCCSSDGVSLHHCKLTWFDGCSIAGWDAWH